MVTAPWALDRYAAARRALPVLRALAARPMVVVALGVLPTLGWVAVPGLGLTALCTLAIDALAGVIARRGMEGSALKEVAADVAADSRSRIYGIGAYFPQGLPDGLWEGRATPRYTMLYVPERSSPGVTQLSADDPVVVSSYAPEALNARRLFLLLHEMGHAGRRNRDAASGPTMAMVRLVTAWALGAACLTTAPVWALPVVLLPFAPAVFYAASLTRLEAEVEADRFALLAAAELTRRGDPRLAPGVRGHPIEDDSVTVRDDSRLSAFELSVRRECFEGMRRVLRSEGGLPNAADCVGHARRYNIGGMEFVLLVASLLAVALAGHLLVEDVAPDPVWPIAVVALFAVLALVISLFRALQVRAIWRCFEMQCPDHLSAYLRDLAAPHSIRASRF